jgi:hypothetical protein
MKLDYGLYMAEQEGLLDTDRKNKILDIINEFIDAYYSGSDINNFIFQNEIFNKYCFYPTTSEVSLIKREVEKRI